MVNADNHFIINNLLLQKISDDFQVFTKNHYTKFIFANQSRNFLPMIKRKLGAVEVKRNISSNDFYSAELVGAKIRSHGWNEGGLCPFHDDKKPGSFHVSLASGGYHCFACGASGGDIISFTMHLYGLSFSDAINKLVNDWGLA